MDTLSEEIQCHCGYGVWLEICIDGKYLQDCMGRSLILNCLKSLQEFMQNESYKTDKMSITCSHGFDEWHDEDIRQFLNDNLRISNPPLKGLKFACTRNATTLHRRGKVTRELLNFITENEANQLSELTFNSVKFLDDDMDNIAAMCEHENSSIQTLALDSCDLSKQQLIRLAAMLERQTCLNKLELTFITLHESCEKTQFLDAGIKTICSASLQITHLELKHCDMVASDMECLVESLRRPVCKVEHLHMRDDKLPRASLLRLSDAVRKEEIKLTTLRVASGNLHQDFVSHIQDYFDQASEKKLRHLEITNFRGFNPDKLDQIAAMAIASPLQSIRAYSDYDVRVDLIELCNSAIRSYYIGPTSNAIMHFNARCSSKWFQIALLLLTPRTRPNLLIKELVKLVMLSFSF